VLSIAAKRDSRKSIGAAAALKTRIGLVQKVARCKCGA